MNSDHFRLSPFMEIFMTLNIKIARTIVLAAATGLTTTWPGTESIAQESKQPITVTVRGRVLDDESHPIPGETVRVRVYVSGVATPFEGRSDKDGRYMVQVPLQPSQSIDKIRFDHPLKHLEEMTLFSGVDASDEINKLMSDIDGPETYERNINQLLVYEGIYYRKIAVGAAEPGELERIRDALTKMPKPGGGSKQLEDMASDGVRIQLLAKKRAEVFALYGLDPDAQAKIAGLGVCGKCALHVTAECKNTVIVASGGPRLYFVNDGAFFKGNHELLCHTTVPVSIEGKITREVGPSKTGAVAFGEIQGTKIGRPVGEHHRRQGGRARGDRTVLELRPEADTGMPERAPLQDPGCYPAFLATRERRSPHEKRDVRGHGHRREESDPGFRGSDHTENRRRDPCRGVGRELNNEVPARIRPCEIQIRSPATCVGVLAC